MTRKHLICLECGGDTHKEGLDDERGEIKKVVCSHCDNEGRVIDFGGMNPRTSIQEGSFAQVTTKGMQTLRENIGFTPVYEQ